MPQLYKTDRPRAITIYIPSSLADRIDLLLADPLTGRTRHGAKSKLITRLLREWLAQGATNPQEDSTNDPL